MRAILVSTGGEPITQFQVPASAGTYTLSVSVARDEPWTRRATRVDATWTFRSGHVNGDQPQSLPLMVVRARPDTDPYDWSPAGRRVRFPVWVERVSGAAATSIKDLALDISCDDGVTWLPAGLHPDHDRWLATISHPDGGPGFVSLRGRATDTAGSTVAQTVVRAYALR
jgi:hypothetical protein